MGVEDWSYSQENTAENFESQEAQRVIEETTQQLGLLELDVLNAKKLNESKGWDDAALNNAKSLIGDFYTIEGDNENQLNTWTKKEKVVFNVSSVKNYLSILYKRLSVQGAPGYTEMSKEKIFGATILAIQIALECIKRTPPQEGTYDVGVINGNFNKETENVIKDFQRDYLGLKNMDGKPGKKTIQKIIELLGNKDYITISEEVKIGNLLEQNQNTGFRAYSTDELEIRLKSESLYDYSKYLPPKSKKPTKAVRTNNPGNIHDTTVWGEKGKRIPGCIGYEPSKNGKFSVFETPLDGWNALVNKIKAMQQGLSSTYKPNFSIKQYFKVYCKGDASYPGKVAGFLNVPQTTKVGDLDPEKFACAISNVEDGLMFQKLQDKGIITQSILQKDSLKIRN